LWHTGGRFTPSLRRFRRFGHNPDGRRAVRPDRAPAAPPGGGLDVFPLKDDIPGERAPVVCILLIVINVLVFLYELSFGPSIERFVTAYAVVPGRFVDHPMSQFPTLFTSMFLHGGWGHLFGNMLYLWIFGDNVEDRLGHVGFLVFYLVCGVAAGFAHILTSGGSMVPTVGASGAIAGVLGAYLVLFPGARVLTLLPTFTTIYIPSIFFLGIWFLMQVFSGAIQLSVARGTGGVAFLAHVGGFVVGALIGMFARGAGRARAPA
jgi:membrane associated rhomboid family serine protease